jgi:beta-lactamase regulating signal transducer with metallopeptidase domain
MTVLMASIVDVTIILAIGLTLAAALRRRSAAVRHAVLTTSIVCAALAPALELVLPQLPVIRGFGSGVEQSSEIRFGGESPVIVAEAAAAEASSWPAVSWPVVVVGAWVVATVITFAGLALSLWRLRRLGASCAPVSGPWRALTDAVARECGVRRPVELLQSTDRRLLVTYGMFRPRIILPAGAGDWSSDRQAVVLRHELAHIRRHDAGIQLAGEVLRVMQPFNPLVWIACRQQRRESEYACDDAVLSAGVAPADYATHLFDIAKGFSGRQTIWATAPAIAEPSTLERRIVAMLQHQKNRQPVSRMGWAFVAIVAVAVSLPLAAIGVAPAPPSLPDPNSPSVSVLAAPPLSTPSVTAKTPVPPARKNARAQQASLSGAVHDETGGVIPGASVSLTNSQTQESAAAVTNVSGAFQFVNLPPGQYVLVTQLSGFRKRQVSIDLSAGSAASLTVTLEVGALSEALTVSCKAPSVIDRFFPTLSAQERPSAPIRVGGSIKAPRKTKDVRPVCPDAGVTDPAVVILEGYVGVDGFVTGLKALSEAETVPARFIESAMDAVQQWEFTPTLLNGVPVPVVFTVTVSFTRG